MGIKKGTKLKRPRVIVTAEPGSIEHTVLQVVQDAYYKAPTKLQDAIKVTANKIRRIIAWHYSDMPPTPLIKRDMNQRIGPGKDPWNRTPIWVLAQRYCPELKEIPVGRPKKYGRYL